MFNDSIRTELKDCHVLPSRKGTPPRISIVKSDWEIACEAITGREDFEYFKDDLYDNVKQILEVPLGIWISGPSGCGKTQTPNVIAKELNYGCFRMDMNGHATDEKIIGSPRAMVDKESRTMYIAWVRSTLEKAMKYGTDGKGNVTGPPAIMVINEFSSAPQETLFVLQPVLEEGIMIIDEDGGREVKAHPKFTIVATDNTKGTGDYIGKYGGTNPVNSSTRDRFPFLLEAKYDSKIERKILQSILLGKKEPFTSIGSRHVDDVIKKMCDTANLIRSADSSAAGGSASISFDMSYRRSKAWAAGISIFGGKIGKAYEMSIVSYMEPSQQSVMRELFQRIWNHEPTKFDTIEKGSTK